MAEHVGGADDNMPLVFGRVEKDNLDEFVSVERWWLVRRWLQQCVREHLLQW